MPRQIKVYDRFHGGLNNSADPRDIAQDEVSDIDNMMVDKVGQLRTMGSVTAATGITETIPAITVPTGRGLFVFKSDYTVFAENVLSVTDTGGNARYDIFAVLDLPDSFGVGDTVFHGGFSVAAYNGKKVVTNILIGEQSYDTADAFSTNDTGYTIWFENSDLTSVWGYTGACWYILVANASATHSCSILAIPITSPWTSAKSQLWMTDVIDFGSTAGMIPTCYFVDGWVRVCDRHGGVNAPVQAFGFVKPTATTHLKRDGMFGVVNAKPAAPAVSGATGCVVSDYDAIIGTGQAGGNNTTLVGSVNFTYAADYPDLDVYSPSRNEVVAISAFPAATQLTTANLGVTWVGATFRIYPQMGTGFVVGLKDTAGGTWQASSNVYEFAQTYIYDEGQETLPAKITNGGTTMVWGGSNYSPADNTYLTIRVHAAGWTGNALAGEDRTNMYPMRVRGGRTYYRNYGSDDNWKLLVDIDLIRGIRTILDGQFTAWTAETTPTLTLAQYKYYAEAISYDPQVITYEDINGIPQDTQMSLCSFGSVCVLNKRAFVANVVYDLGGSAYAVYGDRIQYTPVGKYDMFPDAFYLDLALDDGDEFVALQGFADRILAFKNRKLYVINIAQPAESEWFVEAVHPNMGVPNPGATFAYDEGIVWVNDYGCFVYDGETITNLITREVTDTEGNVQRLLGRIDENTWNTFLTANAVVGVDPLLHQIIVIGDTTVTAGATYVYDLLTGSWSKSANRFAQAAGDKYTNFAVYDNQLIIGHSVV